MGTASLAGVAPDDRAAGVIPVVSPSAGLGSSTAFDGKLGTAVKGFTIDASHTVRDGDTSQAGAVREGPSTNAGHAVWDVNAGQAGAPGEG